jgi:hypothetical protein
MLPARAAARAALDRAGDGAEADRRPRVHGAAAPPPHGPAQRHPVRVKAQVPLLRVDLPVDRCVVLEQEKRAGQGQGTVCALGEA